MAMNFEWVDQLRALMRRPAWLDRLIIKGRRQKGANGRCLSYKADGPKQLLVDVSVISRHDAGTGIQRVVRALLNQMLSEPPSGFIIRAVAGMGKKPYQYIEWGDFTSGLLNGRKVEVKPGDVFLGLDFATHAIYRHRRQLAEWKRSGARMAFLIHDLLPENQPGWFSPLTVIQYRRWIREIVAQADIVFCNSKSTQADFQAFVREHFRLSESEIETYVLPMGWNIEQAKWEGSDQIQLYDKPARHFDDQLVILMVGTIEPRKGHKQALRAFEKLWNAGCKHMLVLVGRPGWKTVTLQSEIRKSNYYGSLLYWFDAASDNFLDQMYRECDGVLLASFGEGFGLPLIEASQFHKPILARDLPVFKEQGIKCIEYFQTSSPEQLASELERWFESLEIKTRCDLQSLKPVDWAEARIALYEKLAGE
jgi:glycosyltransferase involved in cell wall biosynthesis